MNLPNIDVSAESVLQNLWRASWQAMVLAAVVLMIQRLLGSRMGGRGRYLLWSVVILRLMLPVLPQSPVSVYNLTHRALKTIQPKPFPEIAAVPIESLNRGTEIDTPFGYPWDAPFIDEVEWSHSAGRSDETRLQTRSAWSIPQFLLLAWILAAGGIVIRLIFASLNWKRSLGALHPCDDPGVTHLVAVAARELSMTRSPGILMGERVPTPAVVGLLKPQLLLPARVISQCTADEIRLILLHELAHIKRHDIAANWLVAAACIVHWFNPFVWLIAARIRTDRELACDETVLAACTASDSQAYGRTLLRLIEVLSPTPADRYPQLVGILESSAPMQRRMRMIARYTPQSSSRWIWVGLVLIALGCTSLTDSVRGQAPQAGPATQPTVRIRQAPTPAPDEVVLQAQLRRNMPEMRFDGIEFVKVIDFLRDVTGANIFVNWRALETAGIDRKSAVTIQLRDVPFEQALRRILRDVGGGAVRLDYVVEGNILTITTEEDAASETKTVFYDVTDLLISPDGTPLPTQERYQTVDSLVSLIQDMVARDSWRDNGGNVGSAREFRGKLIVTQTARNHEQIEVLLTRVREKPTTQPRPLTAAK